MPAKIMSVRELPAIVADQKRYEIHSAYMSKERCSRPTIRVQDHVTNRILLVRLPKVMEPVVRVTWEM